MVYNAYGPIAPPQLAFLIMIIALFVSLRKTQSDDIADLLMQVTKTWVKIKDRNILGKTCSVKNTLRCVKTTSVGLKQNNSQRSR